MELTSKAETINSNLATVKIKATATNLTITMKIAEALKATLTQLLDQALLQMVTVTNNLSKTRKGSELSQSHSCQDPKLVMKMMRKKKISLDLTRGLTMTILLHPTDLEQTKVLLLLGKSLKALSTLSSLQKTIKVSRSLSLITGTQNLHVQWFLQNWVNK